MRFEVMRFAKQARHLHISFDCDSMDPIHHPGVNTPVCGGFMDDEMLPLLEDLLKLDHISSMDIVEYNPTCDLNQNTLNLILNINRIVKTQLGRK